MLRCCYVRRYLSLFVTVFIGTEIAGSLAFHVSSSSLFLRVSREKEAQFICRTIRQPRETSSEFRSIRRVVAHGIQRTRVTLSRLTRDEKCFYIRARSFEPRDIQRHSRYYGISAILELVSDVAQMRFHLRSNAHIDSWVSRAGLKPTWRNLRKNWRTLRRCEKPPRRNFFIWFFSIAHCSRGIRLRVSRFAFILVTWLSIVPNLLAQLLSPK